MHAAEALMKPEAAPFVRAPVDCSQTEACPAIPLRPDAAASTASHPNVRDDGQRPSLGTRGGVMELIWVGEKGNIFGRGWTGGIGLICLFKLVVARNAQWIGKAVPFPIGGF